LEINKVKKLNDENKIETQIKDAELVRIKRLQIAKGATKLFIKKGYFKTSIREISKATGITIGNLYDYITKKEDILYLVFEVFHSTWSNKLEREKVLNIEDPVEQLKVALQMMFEIVSTHGDMVLLMYTESKLLPKEFLKKILENESNLVKYFETILKGGVENGVFKIKDPFLMANVIVYLLSMGPLRGWNLRNRYKVKEVNEYLMESMLNGILHVSQATTEKASVLLQETREGTVEAEPMKFEI
jgi:AcrR family transcriptional regulator